VFVPTTGTWSGSLRRHQILSKKDLSGDSDDSSDSDDSATDFKGLVIARSANLCKF
jgi:hypothetical protein